MEPAGPADGEDELGPPARLAPSPHSEAVAHELRGLSLQPSPCRMLAGLCRELHPPGQLLEQHGPSGTHCGVGIFKTPAGVYYK
uniref:Uncharacterized protein n=1 Tax=Ficedula albicollis TaxID=59894 RepID=A0A803W498_FICAL